MPRRKVKKIAKGKRSTVGRTTGTASPLEKTFKELPGRLAAQGRKDLGVLKQKEKKLQAQLKKATTQKTTATKQQTTLTGKYKTKPTAAGRKQLATSKLGVTKATGAVKDLTTQLAALKAQIKTQTSHTGKYAAIGKHIAAFHKAWDVKTAKTVKPTTAKRKRAGKKTKTTTTSNTPGSTYNTDTTSKNEFEVTE
jgi:hypothetical protein